MCIWECYFVGLYLGGVECYCGLCLLNGGCCIIGCLLCWCIFFVEVYGVIECDFGVVVDWFVFGEWCLVFGECGFEWMGVVGDKNVICFYFSVILNFYICYDVCNGVCKGCCVVCNDKVEVVV